MIVQRLRALRHCNIALPLFNQPADLLHDRVRLRLSHGPDGYHDRVDHRLLDISSDFLIIIELNNPLIDNGNFLRQKGMDGHARLHCRHDDRVGDLQQIHGRLSAVHPLRLKVTDKVIHDLIGPFLIARKHSGMHTALILIFQSAVHHSAAFFSQIEAAGADFAVGPLSFPGIAVIQGAHTLPECIPHLGYLSGGSADPDADVKLILFQHILLQTAVNLHNPVKELRLILSMHKENDRTLIVYRRNRQHAADLPWKLLRNLHADLLLPGVTPFHFLPEAQDHGNCGIDSPSSPDFLSAKIFLRLLCRSLSPDHSQDKQLQKFVLLLSNPFFHGPVAVHQPFHLFRDVHQLAAPDGAALLFRSISRHPLRQRGNRFVQQIYDNHTDGQYKDSGNRKHHEPARCSGQVPFRSHIADPSKDRGPSSGNDIFSRIHSLRLFSAIFGIKLRSRRGKPFIRGIDRISLAVHHGKLPASLPAGAEEFLEVNIHNHHAVHISPGIRRLQDQRKRTGLHRIPPAGFQHVDRSLLYPPAPVIPSKAVASVVKQLLHILLVDHAFIGVHSLIADHPSRIHINKGVTGYVIGYDSVPR